MPERTPAVPLPEMEIMKVNPSLTK